MGASTSVQRGCVGDCICEKSCKCRANFNMGSTSYCPCRNGNTQMDEQPLTSPPKILRKLKGIAVCAGSAFLGYKSVGITRLTLQVIRILRIKLSILVWNLETKEACLLENAKRFCFTTRMRLNQDRGLILKEGMLSDLWNYLYTNLSNSNRIIQCCIL